MSIVHSVALLAAMLVAFVVALIAMVALTYIERCSLRRPIVTLYYRHTDGRYQVGSRLLPESSGVGGTILEALGGFLAQHGKQFVRAKDPETLAIRLVKEDA